MKYKQVTYCMRHFCATLLLLLLAQFAYAQASDWPNKQVSIVVPLTLLLAKLLYA